MDHDQMALFATRYGKARFYQALSLALMDEIARLLPDRQHFQEVCYKCAQDAANNEIARMAHNTPDEWQRDPLYAELPQDILILSANGIEEAKKLFLAVVDES